LATAVGTFGVAGATVYVGRKAKGIKDEIRERVQKLARTITNLRFRLLSDSQEDVQITKIVSDDESGTAGESITTYEATISLPGNSYRGYTASTMKPYYGWGTTVQDAVVDAMRGINGKLDRSTQRIY
jgi:hypothetical protein